MAGGDRVCISSTLHGRSCRAATSAVRTRPAVWTAAHKAGHTLGVSLAARLRPFALSAHTFSRTAASATCVRRVRASGSFLVVIERDIFVDGRLRVLYHASGAEPWTRCRLHPCNQTIDASCCFSCGECIPGTNSCNCSQLTSSCAASPARRGGWARRSRACRPEWRRSTSAPGLGRGAQRLRVHCAAAARALPARRGPFRASAPSLPARARRHQVGAYRRVGRPQRAHRGGGGRAAALPHLRASADGSARGAAALLGLQFALCLFQFTASSELFATPPASYSSGRASRGTTGPPRWRRWRERTYRPTPSDHSTARIVPSAARGRVGGGGLQAGRGTPRWPSPQAGLWIWLCISLARMKVLLSS